MKHLGSQHLKIVVNNLRVNETAEGETIEQQIERMMQNKEPITSTEALIYTERSEGVRPEMNIRTDRFEIAIEATEKIQRSYSARREERAKEKEAKVKELESAQGTTETPKTA